MSILIKGMAMPTSCFDNVMLCNDGRVFVYKNGEWVKSWTAVPVPPHGRCIDADALADVFRGFIAMYDSCPFSQLSLPDKSRRDELQSSLAEVINAPTIIPAEEGET